MSFDGLAAEIGRIRPLEVYGRVASVQGLLVEVAGPVHEMSVGCRLTVSGFGGAHVAMEVVGFRGDCALCLPFGSMEGVRLGAKASILSASAHPRCETKRWPACCGKCVFPSSAATSPR